MAHIHYKFASKRSSDTVVFDGPHVTLRELKRLIMEREKLRAGDCDLQITNAQTKEEFTDDEGLIAKGSSVIVRRIPVIGARSGSNAKIRNAERPDGHLHQQFGAVRAMGAQSSSSTLPLFSKMTNLAFVDASEEDKLKVLVNQSLYDSMSYNMKVGPGLPANYTCFRCGSTGHHIRNCPDKSTEAPLRIKKSTGIPRSFMVEVDDPSIKGAMLTNCGHYAIPAIHAKAYAVGKKEKPPFAPQELPVSKEEDPVPNELLCLICKEMLCDAVVIPCCGNSFCDDCIRTALLDSDQHTCPTCKESNVSPDTLIANKFLRQAVNTFQKDQGQSKSAVGSDGASELPAWAPAPVVKRKPQQSAQRQQALEAPSSGQGCLAPPLPAGHAPPVPPGHAPPPAVAGASAQPLPPRANAFKKEPDERTSDEAAAAAQPSTEGSVTDATASAPVSDSACEEKPQTVGVTPQPSSTDPVPVPGPVWPPTYWESTTTTTTTCPPTSTTSSTYPPVPPPLFPSPHFHGFLPAQHHLNSYPPGYPPAAPIWSIQPPQGASIPPLCSSTNDWYKHQREKTESRSPHRGSTHRRSSSRSKSSKSSRSYSRSSSRSRSRSRSVSRSRPRSPYSRSRHLHAHSQSSYTYSYGYKRSPTPSSSSSPRLRQRSRSKSPSDQRKKGHHGRHHSKRSSPGREGGGRAEERRAEADPSGELDRQRYLQWKRDYEEWCDKYLSSYVSHFNQLPPPPLALPPSPRPHREEGEGEGEARSPGADARRRRRHHHHRRRSSAHAANRSSPSRSSSDRRSSPSRSSSNGRSSPSRSSNPSRSPASRLSSDGGSTPSKPRVAARRGDGGRDPKRPPRKGKGGASPREPSASAQPREKASKGSECKRERGGRKRSEKEEKQTSRGAGRDRSGSSKTPRSDSRSEKSGKRKGDGAKAAEAPSSKCPRRKNAEVPRTCESDSQHPSDKKRSGQEKKARPVSDGGIWEEGMKVKPQKRIILNISLDGRKKEEENEQAQTACSQGKPREESPKADNEGEEKAMEVEVSGEEGGEAKGVVDPDESAAWKEDGRDDQDQGTEREEKEGWCHISRGEEEEQSQGMHEGMKASTDKEAMSEGMRSEGQERREPEDASAETESRAELELPMETEEEGTRSRSLQDSGRHDSCGNGLERKLMEESTQDGALGEEDRLKQAPCSKWEKEESEEPQQDEEPKAESSLGSVSKMEKCTFPSSHCVAAPSGGQEWLYSSSSRDCKREVEMEDRSRQKEKEGRRSQERRKEEEEENHRDTEEERSKRDFRDDQGTIQDPQLHQCSGSLSVPSHNCTDKAAGDPQPPPLPPPQCRGEEEGPLPSEGTKNTSENHVTVEKEGTGDADTDKVAKDGGDATGREAEEGARPSGSSAGRESSREYGWKEWRRKKEKREAALLEEWEKHNHKKSKESRDGREH